jgi:pimeloyl-ACP methyl ester carboxylesterase
MTITIPSTGDVELEAHLALPSGARETGRPGVVLCHGFPSGQVSARVVGGDLSELADRAAREMGWVALSFRFRGCGESTGDFTLASWVADARAAIAHLRQHGDVDSMWIVGFGTGGAVGLAAAVAEDDVAGAALLGTPADFDDWANHPDRLLSHAHAVGAIRQADFPSDLAGWKAELRQVRASAAAESFGDRPLLVVHGSDDDLVPSFDGRIIADAHGDAELRIIDGAGHQLRHDPRALAILLGWLDRQHDAAVSR